MDVCNVKPTFHQCKAVLKTSIQRTTTMDTLALYYPQDFMKDYF